MEVGSMCDTTPTSLKSHDFSAPAMCVEWRRRWVGWWVALWVGFFLFCKLSHHPTRLMGVRMGGAAPHGGGLFCFARCFALVSAERTAGASTPHHFLRQPAFTHQRSALCAAPALEARRRSQTRSKSASSPEPSPLL